jgi:hypothetical protein
MFSHVTADRRLLGFDIGDWAMLFAGLGLAMALVALFA